ncbi:unnamed protein product [Candidula unifasciata]|uniref:Forkhead box protein N3 n=1 Tax=Candidula unifasciata TaxID=100452 RepID=A0A8S4A1W7_9EUPU|nr:unnamed protein product [Candidula unifasciata]
MVPSCKLPEESDASMRARLFTSLSQSFPHSQLYKALHGGEDIILNAGDNSEDDDDSLYGDHLSNSCFASLRMDRRDSDDFDDDLRSLEWLQNEDLLKNIGGEKLDKEDDSEEQKENEDIKPDIHLLQGASGQQPANLSYLPQKHINSKPPYSFSCLIFMAVEASPEKRLPVKDIYNWILTQFPYFQNAPTGWKNSVRHNLSLNKCFKKVEKDKGQSIGKGSLWCIDPAYRPNLLQALRKTPYHPYHQLQMTSTQPQNYIQCQTLPGCGRTVLPLTQRPVPNTVSPHLFPFLSRRLAQTSFDVDSEMKDVAQTLVALKSSYKKELSDSSSGEDTGPTWRHHRKFVRRPSSPVVITDHPYDDHAYSSTRVLDDDAPSPSSSSSIDEEYDFGDADEECDSEYQSDMDWDSDDDKDDVDGDLPNNKKLRIDMQAEREEAAAIEENEEDEQKKLHEGASALLNLAGLLLNHHSNNASSDAVVDSHIKDIRDEQRHIEQKKKISKKAKNVKKSPAYQKEEKMEQRKRSVSKRKNAGSNGKYDSGEYSLEKPGKSTAKGRFSSSGLQNTVKSESPMSTVAESEKVSSSSSKSKPVQSSTSKQTVGRRKLKLSKAFSSSTKLISSVTAKNTTDSKTFKNHTLSSKSKKNLPKKGTPKSIQLKKVKAGAENCSKITTSESSAHAKAESSQVTSSSDSTNNNDSIKKEVVDEEEDILVWSDQKQPDSGDHAVDEKKNHGIKSGHKGPSLAVFSHINGDTISPAGDAPARPKVKSAAVKREKSSESKSAHSSPKVASSSTVDAVKSHGSKSSPSKSVSNIPPPPTTLHKSPHFTRFSKKKAALS